MKKYFLTILILVVCCVGLSLFISRPKTSNEEYKYQTNIIKVSIDGGVIFKGTYEVVSGIRLFELIEMAGGLDESADVSKINLNEVITTPKSYTIPLVSTYLKEKVNINTASLSLLITVPNITEQRAASIIIYRTTNGPFKCIEELINVKYIGNATFDKIKDYVTV